MPGRSLVQVTLKGAENTSVSREEFDLNGVSELTLKIEFANSTVGGQSPCKWRSFSSFLVLCLIVSALTGES